EPLEDISDGLLHGSFVGDIQNQSQGLGSLGQQRGGFRQAFGRPVDQSQTGSFVRQALCRRTANAAASAGDDRYTALKSHTLQAPSFSLERVLWLFCL